jgi:hypothetical protein
MNCKCFKSVNEGQQSFRITRKLIDSIYTKARTVKKKGELVLTIPCDEKYNYVLNCKITKNKI